MEALFDNGRMIDIAIAVLAAEFLCVALAWRELRFLVPTMLSGLMLMLAWRFHEAGFGWLWIAAPLLSSAFWHAFDLWQRWPRAQREGVSTEAAVLPDAMPAALPHSARVPR